MSLLDRHRPLWEAVLIEGVEGDRVAIDAEPADDEARRAVAQSNAVAQSYAVERFRGVADRYGLQILIVGMMFLGGIAGSTAGGVKTYRVGFLTRSASGEVRA